MNYQADAQHKETSDEHRPSLTLTEYSQAAVLTDRLPQDDLVPVLMGLYGEVGSILSSAKKSQREEAAYASYRQDVIEDFGDALWYFAGLTTRLGANLVSILRDAERATSILDTTHELANTPVLLSKALLDLGQSAAALLTINRLDSQSLHLLETFADSYSLALKMFDVGLTEVMWVNRAKTHGRFLNPEVSKLPTFDRDFPIEERLPDRFEIAITQRASGQSYLQWNGVFIGDPLTDNSVDHDGYRFHDVFHFAHAAILHWSPTFRALIKQKRESNPVVDETQDGGRAIVVEEGLTAWIFSCARHLSLFEGHNGVSFDLLKTVEQFVQGYEVDSCPLRLWEDAILKGYDVFRMVRQNSGGIVIGDRTNRTFEYRSLSEKGE